jgi:hypothetical protein
MAGKSLIRDAAELDLERLGDGEVSLKEVMAL